MIYFVTKQTHMTLHVSLLVIGYANILSRYHIASALAHKLCIAVFTKVLELRESAQHKLISQ